MNKKNLIILAVALVLIATLAIGLILRGCSTIQDPQQTTAAEQTGTENEGETTQTTQSAQTTEATENTTGTEPDSIKPTVDPTRPTLIGTESLGTDGILEEDDDLPASGGNSNTQQSTQPQETKPQQTTKPQETKPQDSGNTSVEPEATKPTEGNSSEAEKPTQSTTPSGPKELTYDEYWALSGQEQLNYIMAFSSMNDFVAWYQRAAADVEDAPVIELDGSVDLEQLFGKK